MSPNNRNFWKCVTDQISKNNDVNNKENTKHFKKYKSSGRKTYRFLENNLIIPRVNNLEKKLAAASINETFIGRKQKLAEIKIESKAKEGPQKNLFDKSNCNAIETLNDISNQQNDDNCQVNSWLSQSNGKFILDYDRVIENQADQKSNNLVSPKSGSASPSKEKVQELSIARRRKEKQKVKMTNNSAGQDDLREERNYILFETEGNNKNSKHNLAIQKSTEKSSYKQIQPVHAKLQSSNNKLRISSLCYKILQNPTNFFIIFLLIFLLFVLGKQWINNEWIEM